MAELPKAIFKYVGPDRIDIIEKARIRFTPPTACNDPFEAQLCIDGFEDEALINKKVDEIERRYHRRHVLRQHSLGGKPASFEQFRKIPEQYHKRAMQELKADPRRIRGRAAERVRKFWDEIGILSLSANEKSLLMWAHYTDSHKGMLIEFDPKHPFFNPPDAGNSIEFGTLTKVVYREKRPRHRIGEVPTPADFCVKSLAWEYEDEWRVFQLLEKSDEKLQTEGGIVHLFNLPPESVKRVVMGYQMESEKRKELTNAIRANPALREIQIQQAKLDLDAFSLNYVP